MAKEKTRQERRYVSKNAGLSISLPDGMTYLDKSGGAVRIRSMIKFPARGGKMFNTEYAAIQDFIEGNESEGIIPCNAFRMGKVTRVPTAEEIEQRMVQKAQEDALANYKFIVEDTGVNLPFRDMPMKNALATANKIGAEFADKDDKPLPKDEIVDNIEKLVYGEVISKPAIKTDPPADHGGGPDKPK